MALQAADFIEPAGELNEGLFPGADLTAYVQAWITDAESRTNDEAAQDAWVYHRAYTTIANRIHAGLASEKKGDAAASRSDAQFAYWSGRASAALARYAARTGTAGPVLTAVGFTT